MNTRTDLGAASAPAAASDPLQRLIEPVSAGHFDELRGHLSDGSNRPAALCPDWADFFGHLGSDGPAGLDQRSAQLKRQIRDNGVTYNVYADPNNPQRPWALDLFPLIISPESWQRIEAGVLQRVRVLDRVMADIYGPQRLLAHGLLPSALVHGHPGYLRSMHGVQPAAGMHLHIAAFDLARGPDGHWWLLSQRTQAPSGLGYLLENRLAVSRLFPKAFEGMRVQRLAASYRDLIEHLKAASPAGADAHIALLTPGPFNETYFEHAYLARYLGLTLVEGSDLTVRDQRLYLKTLAGLEPIDGLLKRLDDQFLDPLELRSDSQLGVPGLLQALRCGNLLVANTPGSALLESPALLGFLPALARHLLDEELQLPALPTWWCGEHAALQDVLPRMAECFIKPTYPGASSHGSFDAVLGRTLSARERDEWAGRILRQGDDHTLQDYLAPSQMPSWQGSAVASARPIQPRSVVLRVFALANGVQSWRVLPGGLARMINTNAAVASMQRGGSSADVWVVRQPSVDHTTLLKPRLGISALTQRKRLVTSRSAENLFWLGRYTERAENSIRLCRLILEWLHGEDTPASTLLNWLGGEALRSALVLPDAPTALQARRVFERSLIAALDDDQLGSSVGFNLRAVRQAAASVRERLSPEHWKVIVQAESTFTQQCQEQLRTGTYSHIDALRALEVCSTLTAAITGAQIDRMVRDDGWRLLSIGRHIERLGFLAAALARGVACRSVFEPGGFEAMLALFDSTITFRAQYQQSREVAALLNLLVLDRDNPRSLAWVAQTLRGRLAKLTGCAPGQLGALSRSVPDPAEWSLAALCGADDGDQPAELTALLERCSASAFALSDQIGALYFTHSDQAKRSVGI